MSGSFDIKHWLRLSLAEGVGALTTRQLLQTFESPGAVFAAGLAELKRHVPAKTAQALIENAEAPAVAAALKWLQEDCRHVLTLADERYPPALLNLPDPPIVLYVQGDVGRLNQPLIAVVGSRNASAPGVKNTEIFARALADAGLGVVSGLAQGVDSAAHKGALAGRAGTVAVTGTGLDIVYPKSNRQLATDIVKKGALISEFPLGTRPLAANFPRRNRIISGLARACLVMEATPKSGSLITAHLAGEQGKDVFAVPGSINSPMHRGCHALIKQGAVLTENIHDILGELNWQTPPPPVVYEEAPASAAGEGGLLPFINFEPTSVDDIANRSGMSAAALMPELLELEINGKIASTAGGKYQRI